MCNYNGKCNTFQVPLGKTEVAYSFKIIHTFYFILAYSKYGKPFMG